MVAAVNVYRQVFGNNCKGGLFAIGFYDGGTFFVVIGFAVFEHCRAAEYGTGVCADFLSPSTLRLFFVKQPADFAGSKLLGSFGFGLTAYVVASYAACCRALQVVAV